VTSETRPREDEVQEDRTPSLPPGEDDAVRVGASSPADDAVADRGRSRRGGRLSLPLVPTLLVLLVLLLGATAYLWSTRPGASPVRTGDYVDALQAARSGVVDLTSFDHLTLDDDIEQIRRVATGELREEAVAELDASRQQIAEAEAVVNTEVVGGGVTRATGSDATVWLVIESTQQSNAGPQAQVVRYRIEVALEKPEDRWLLSGIKGTGTENE
jgi:Mce-associated membrane protein